MLDYFIVNQNSFQINKFWKASGQYGISISIHSIKLKTREPIITSNRMFTHLINSIGELDEDNPYYKKKKSFIKSKPFKCYICFVDDCTQKTVYECCNKETCLDCYEKWEEKNKTCPFCRAHI